MPPVAMEERMAGARRTSFLRGVRNENSSLTDGTGAALLGISWVEVVGEQGRADSEILVSFLMSRVDKVYCADEWIDERIEGSDMDVGSWFFIAVVHDELATWVVCMV